MQGRQPFEQKKLGQEVVKQWGPGFGRGRVESPEPPVFRRLSLFKGKSVPGGCCVLWIGHFDKLTIAVSLPHVLYPS